MPMLKVAHLNEQGQNMIIVPLDQNFGQLTDAEKNNQVDSIQVAATSAGLAGTVVPVWQDHSGRMGYMAPKPWHPLFQTLSMATIQRSINKEISW